MNIKSKFIVGRVKKEIVNMVKYEVIIFFI